MTPGQRPSVRPLGLPRRSPPPPPRPRREWWTRLLGVRRFASFRDDLRARLAAACRLEDPPPERFGFRFDTALRLFLVTAEQGVSAGTRRLVVCCPGFAVDCLETLEEIAMRGRATFLAAGGESFEYVPALNDGAAQVESLARLAVRALGARA